MKCVRTLIALAIASFALSASAATLPTDGSWTEVDFDGPGSALYDLGSLDTSFSFNLNQNSVLRIVDAGFSGDRFSISANGSLLGLTSAPVQQDAAAEPVFDAAAAWHDSHFSKGSWNLGAGSYTITGLATLSPFSGGFGYMSVTAVPEPTSWGMLLAGLGLIGVIARRNSARRA